MFRSFLQTDCISTHTPLAGRDSMHDLRLHLLSNFYSHAPRGARPFPKPPKPPPRKFLLTRPSRGATGTIFSCLVEEQFLLTRPSRGATLVCIRPHCARIYFYSHAPRGARRETGILKHFLQTISTHTPLAGRDTFFYCVIAVLANFYSHAPRGARRNYKRHEDCHIRFLLTRPSRGATTETLYLLKEVYISTHTPLAGRDIIAEQTGETMQDFYSHAPRGARRRRHLGNQDKCNFYSHAPRGARPLHLAHAATAPVTYWGGPDFSLKYRVHGDPFRAKNRIFSGEPPGISQLQHLRLTVFACILLVDIASVHPLVYVTPSCHAVILL